MMDAALGRPPRRNGRLERGQREPGVDPVPDRVTDNAPRPGVEDGRETDEPDGDRDVGDVRDPELVRPALAPPWVNAKLMDLFLAEFSARLAPDAHAVMVLDQAGWHGAKALAVPSNVTLVSLPPYAPQLNPVERVWLYLRETYYPLRVLDDYDAVVDAGSNRSVHNGGGITTFATQDMYARLEPALASGMGQLRRDGRQGVAGHQEGFARDRYAAVDLLETSLGISTDRARIAWVGIGDDPWRADLEQVLDEEADEGRAVALAY